MKKIIKLCVILLILIYIIGCTAKKEAIQQKPPQTVFPQEKYQELIRQGDDYFSKMHLYSWRQADEYYAKAYEMKKTPALRDKRFLTLCLSAIREKHEQIVNPAVYEKIDSLGDFPRNPKQQYLFDIVCHYRAIPVIRKYDQGDRELMADKNEKKEVDATLFDLENSPLDTYLYLYCLNYYTFNLKEYNEEMIRILKKHRIFELIEKYSSSPLFLYFYNFKTAVPGKESIEKRFPQYIEFLAFKGNKLFSQNKLRQASKYYERALKWAPDYTNAINGIGNIYFFTIHDYEKAINYYRETLNLDKLNPVALFGKGVSLHNLGKYEESNNVFDFMLENQELHHGEAHYYKAYNWYYLEDPIKARESIDRAKTLLPHSGEVFFLSGLLYYNREKWEEAETDFLRTLYDNQYSPCYPLYYIGMIKIKKKDWSFIKDFSDSIQSFENAVDNMSNKITEIDALEIEEHQKQWMKEKQGLKLEEFKTASRQLIRHMTTTIAKNKDKQKAHEVQNVNAWLNRVKSLLEKDPKILNTRDGEGLTLLHKAIAEDQTKAVRLLLSRGARLDITDNNGYTALHWAVMLGKTEIARILITNGADTNVKTADGFTPLHDAAYGGQKDIVKLLLDNGAVLDARDEAGRTPLDMAIEENQQEVIVLLKPLHLAVKEGNPSTFKELLSKYPRQVNARDENGRTPLHLAAAEGHKEIAWILVNNGVNNGARLDEKDIDGFTPLELAEQSGQADLTQMLLTLGSPVSNREMLAKKLEDNEAVLWYLGGSGWAIKTKKHVLIFDYLPPYDSKFQPGKKPSKPLLANGQLGGEELKDFQVYVFITFERFAPRRNAEAVFELEKSVKNITFISDKQFTKGHKHIFPEFHEKKQIDGMEISTIKSTGIASTLVYLVKVDGLVIFYAGNHGYWKEELKEAYTGEIDYVHANVEPGTLDIIFLNIPIDVMHDQPQSAVIEEGLEYALEKLQPTVLFPITREGDEQVGLHYSKEVEKKNIKTSIHCPLKRGDRFFYQKGKVVK